MNANPEKWGPELPEVSEEILGLADEAERARAEIERQEKLLHALRRKIEIAARKEWSADEIRAARAVAFPE